MNAIWHIRLTIDMTHGAEEAGLGKYGGVWERDTNATYSAKSVEGTVNKITSVCAARTPLEKRESA